LFALRITFKVSSLPTREADHNRGQKKETERGTKMMMIAARGQSLQAEHFLVKSQI
jgi:hypothetical protein